MKFGRTMHRHFVPEWSGHYIDYNLLKCLLKLSQMPEALECLDASILSLDEFLHSHVTRSKATHSNPALNPKKLRWFKEINARAVWRILAKFERRGHGDDPSYGRIKTRWTALELTWEAAFSLLADISSSDVLGDDVRVHDATTADAIMAADRDGLTPLHLAVIGNHTQVALEMIEVLKQDAGERAKSLLGAVLHLALRMEDDDIVRSLLHAHPDLGYRSSRGEVALHVAIQMGNFEHVSLIVEASREQGASLDGPDNSRGWTPLFVACADGNVEMSRLLIDAGSNQTHQDRLGWTAQEIAAFRGHLAVADLFAAPVDYSAGGPARSCSHRRSKVGGISCGHDQAVVITTLGTTGRNRVITGLDLSFCSSAPTPGRYNDDLFVLEISAPSTLDRHRVPLPVLDDQINNPCVFVIPTTAEPCLVFDVLRVAYGKEVLIASGTVSLQGNSKQFGAHRQSLIREQTIPMLERETMRTAGTLTFTPLLVRPFARLQTPQTVDLTRSPSAPPLLIGHRGAGMNINTQKYLQIGENTVGSFLSAAKLGAAFVEFDIQLTRDLKPVVFHDFSLSESGTDVPIHDVTLDQFIHASNIQSPHGNPLSMLGTAHSREEAGRPRSRSLGRQFEAGAAQIKDRMKHTVDFKEKGFKANTRGFFIQDTFATLQEILLALPENIGCDVEIKYPRLHETISAGVAPIAIELNTFVDVVLQQLHENAGNHRIILSSFTPEICILLATKQQAYPVFFITNAGKLPMSDMEVRAASLQGAVHFAERWGLAGIVFACETLLLCPRLVGLVKGRGLVCATYGTPNNEPEMVKLQAEAGVDLIVSDRVGLIAKTLGVDGGTWMLAD
ncbi:putative glycerophosphodiester phosphodiesterase [Podospora aff. communis PSN243]|uniref:Glycerophosphodiester phosphodiesterase n=1 Tax=Podospora aff. communis PSN243 TaxID=3040156 RepID=A0AAV9GH16_9PEZI|nr:putative glycerophosphodiester phosphodiesterase [Podospora aff. communis PSN243]